MVWDLKLEGIGGPAPSCFQGWSGPFGEFLGGTPQEHTFVPEEKSQTQCPRHKIHINIHVDIYR